MRRRINGVLVCQGSDGCTRLEERRGTDGGHDMVGWQGGGIDGDVVMKMTGSVTPSPYHASDRVIG
jgi:hypothetical protein